MKYIVNKPSVWLYKNEDLTGEVSDQLLMGTVVEIISQDDITAYVKTSYEYYGYINIWDIEELHFADSFEKNSVIVRSGCDLLYENKYEKKPFAYISKGSRILLGECIDKRFYECFVGKRRLYIPIYAVEKCKYSKAGEAVCKNALSYVGTTYRWGGKSDRGIDCSGLVFMSSLLSGLEVYRDAVPDERYVYEIPEEEIRPGDLAYFKGHVAVMTGRDSFVHASARKCRVLCDTFGIDISKEDVIMYARIKEKRQSH